MDIFEIAKARILAGGGGKGFYSTEENDAGGTTYTFKATKDSSTAEEKVNFYDYDGTLLYSYSVAEAQAMDNLPKLPSHDGLICQCWNWSLEDIKVHNRAIDVGANYITDDGKSRFYINIRKEDGLKITLYFQQSVFTDGVIINWGDGNEEMSGYAFQGAAAKSHTYTSAGKYVITFEPVDDCILHFGMTSRIESNPANYYSFFGCSGSYSSDRNYPLEKQVLEKVEIGKNVDLIPEEAFYCQTSLLSITIPNSITEIQKYAFGQCKCLKSVVIPQGTTIGEGIAYQCNSLKHLVIPNGVLAIPKSMCFNCYQLESIVIPDSVKILGNGSTAFGSCRSLKSIVIPDSVTKIGSSCFSGCSSLESIVLPDTVTEIGSQAFSKCSSLSSITLPRQMNGYISTSLFENCSSLRSVTLPDGVTSIGNKAFYNCYSLSNVKVPDSVKNINDSAFYSCTSLKNIQLPEGVTSIGVSAFSDCSSLSNFQIPKNLTSINNYAFQRCSLLTDITIPDSVASIGVYAFSGCDLIESIAIPEGVPSIDNYAFQSCYLLRNVELANSVTTIGDRAFQYCYLLDRIIMPSGVTKIGSQAFSYCHNLKVIDFTSHTAVPTLGSSAFIYIHADAQIRVPAALYDEWIAATNWSAIASKIVAV